ncbi:hypothetical protein JCM19274_2938 [Algibacter lectus]|uniref:Serine protease n=1 Tax=Algibacter lectus TaxID=221126 RepID=A0A090X2I6_9FLAO|nr:trypsin-like peptidase domain-containing protein [Algibacter lectus]GAL82659.1 hypothetical protein JCM19274_2938 [Algibacter lectus]
MGQKINNITLSSVSITAKRLYEDGTEAGKSFMSGCFWYHNEKTYLITNWHNVTGKNPETDENIGSFSPPNIFLLKFKYLIPQEEGMNKVMEAIRSINLFNENLEPFWIEHPTGRKVDIVAIPLDLELPNEAIINHINNQDYIKDWFPEIGNDCFIIGFPEGISGPWNTPIWKRGSVATLPLLDYDDKPVFLLDTIGNSGLSGSPVIGSGNGVYKKDNKKEITLDTIFGSWNNFVGIYAGRISKTGIGSQLGRVWKSYLINEILEK